MSDAERLAALEQAARRSLELLERGRAAEARQLLAAALPAPAEPEALAKPLSDLELDRAFERAEPVADEVFDADRVAEQAIREVDRQLAAGPAAGAPTFATRTMAELLERQGDAEGARRIRETLAREPRREEPAAPPRRRAPRTQVVATLERWLANVKGGH